MTESFKGHVGQSGDHVSASLPLSVHMVQSAVLSASLSLNAHVGQSADRTASLSLPEHLGQSADLSASLSPPVHAGQSADMALHLPGYLVHYVISAVICLVYIVTVMNINIGS